MTTPRLIASLTARNAIAALQIRDEISALLTARETRQATSSVTDMVTELDATFPDAAERDTLYEWLQARMERGSLSGQVAIHECSHAAGESEDTWQGCKTTGYEEHLV